MTYQDILTYSRGEQPPRDSSQFGRKHPLVMAWVKFGVNAISGAIVAMVLVRLFG